MMMIMTNVTNARTDGQHMMA